MKIMITKNQSRLLKLLNMVRRNKMNLEVRANNNKILKKNRLNAEQFDIESKKNEALISKASIKKQKFFPSPAYKRWFREFLAKNKLNRIKSKIKGDINSRY